MRRIIVGVVSDEIARINDSVNEIIDLMIEWPLFSEGSITHTWDDEQHMLIFRIDVQDRENDDLELGRHANLIADQVYKILFAVIEDPGDGSVEVLGMEDV